MLQIIVATSLPSLPCLSLVLRISWVHTILTSLRLLSFIHQGGGESYVSKTASLNVADGEAIAAGSSAKFYIAIKPFTVSNGVLKVAVNGYEKEIEISNKTVFAAGKIKKINFNYDNTAVVNSVTFDFSDPESLGLTKPDASAGTNITSAIVVGDVTLSTTNGRTTTRIWNSQGTCDLRVYKSGGSLTFSVPEGSVITRIVFTGDAALSGYSASVGTLSSGTWIGSNQSVKFTASSTLEISTAVVTYSAGKANTSILSDDITGISARGGSDLESSYTIENPVDGKTISATCDGTVVTAVEADAGTILYTVSANTTTSAREGSITLTYGDVTKLVKVSQLAPVFKVSRTEVELEAAANSSSTIIVTSDFDWYSDASAGAGFTSTPTTCGWTTENPFTDGKTTVTITANAPNASEEGTKTLGTLTFTNMETSETLVVTVKQKSSAIVSGEALPFSFDSGKNDITSNMTQSGLGSDYKSAPKLKFDTANDYLTVKIASAASSISILLKQNGTGTTAEFTIYGSIDGTNYTSIQVFSVNPGNGKTMTATVTEPINSAYRYIKFEYTTKPSSTNIAAGSISIK